MRGRVAVLLVLAAAPGACGGDGAGAGRPGDDAGPPPSARGEPARPTGEQAAYDDAVAAFEAGDFDAAIPAMESLDGYRDAEARAQEFRVGAARKILAQARRKLRRAPQAAVAQAKTSLKYHPTPAARAFLKDATVKLEAFKKRERRKGRG